MCVSGDLVVTKVVDNGGGGNGVQGHSEEAWRHGSVMMLSSSGAWCARDEGAFQILKPFSGLLQL